MPTKPPRLCACGKRVPAGTKCLCMAKSDRERKARFDRTRPNSSQRGYTGTWEKAKADFLAKHPFCRRCGQPADTVDHIKPHKGDPVLFWDRSNWQALCARDHNSAKQREERRTLKR
ncbi:HNH endonuclease [Limimaricola hongkongensis]|uniref:HNH endonuclease signature motif containing protein n=1 Tax=Limimaricola hongkongensis TaxID=278132 RepID=UPI00047827E3|nr:HNH endonuclease [Limimaricola hongkongensis]